MADIQPDIALGIRPPAPPPSMSDTIGMASHLGQLQQSINANQAFQQEQQARSAAGTLIASGLKGQALIDAMQKNPGIGAYAPQLMQEQATLANTLLANQNADLSNRGTVASGYLKSLAANLANPNAQQMDANQKAYEAGLPDDLRTATQSARDATNKALTYGLDLSKPDDQATYRQRLIGMATSANITPQTVEQNLGSSGLQDGLNVRKAPIQFGGQTELIGQGQGSGGVQSETAPQVAPTNALGASGRISFTPQGAADSGAAQAGGTPPAMTPAKAVTQAPVPITPPKPDANGNYPIGWGVPDGAPKNSPITRVAADGKALFTPDMVSPSISGVKDFKGVPARTDDQIATNRQRIADFNGPEQVGQFRAAQTSLSRINEISHDLDNIAAGGKLQNLGPGATMGNQLADLTNKVSDMFGGKPIFDPNVSASAQDFKKQTANLVGTLTQGLGQHSHMALENMQDAVPSLENTYLGSRVIMAGAKSLLQREIDRREYINAWGQNPANQGAIDGAEEKFNSEHPPSDYVNKVYDHFGMTQNGGFRDPSVIINDLHKGYLDSDQAKKLIDTNFPNFKNNPKMQSAVRAKLQELQGKGLDDE